MASIREVFHTRGDDSFKSSRDRRWTLEFSPCAYIKEFYEELHHEEIDDEQAVSIWQKTEDIFENYGMDVEGSDAEDRLRDELLPFMQ